MISKSSNLSRKPSSSSSLPDCLASRLQESGNSGSSTVRDAASQRCKLTIKSDNDNDCPPTSITPCKYQHNNDASNSTVIKKVQLCSAKMDCDKNLTHQEDAAHSKVQLLAKIDSNTVVNMVNYANNPEMVTPNSNEYYSLFLFPKTRLSKIHLLLIYSSLIMLLLLLFLCFFWYLTSK